MLVNAHKQENDRISRIPGTSTSRLSTSDWTLRQLSRHYPIRHVGLRSRSCLGSQHPGTHEAARRASTQRAEALRGGREDGARWVRRDAGLHGIPARALAPDQDEQRDRAHQPRDQEEDEGRRDLPGLQLGRHTGDGEGEVHSGTRVGQEEVVGYVDAGGDGGTERKGGGLEEDGAEDG